MKNDYYYYLPLDLDECLEDNSDCDHVCINEDGSYHCECNDGFQLDDDNRGCSGK